jgi:hypothetical protein
MLEMAMIDTPKLETEFLFKRAEEEAVLAIRTDHPNAAAAHFDLSLRYGERAREALTGDPAPVEIMEQELPRQA